MDQDRIMKVTDDKGNEVEMYILFTTRLDEYNKNYIFYTDPKDSEGQVFVSSYTEDNKLEQIENPEEWNALEEVFNEFLEEAQSTDFDNQCENCSSDCEGQCDQSCEGCKEK
ncbi:MAG: DUF1292 domain-containing protein [Bacilli bacterium]|nr:DUF1292 domain-containing protein [Bacilli bacterium]